MNINKTKIHIDVGLGKPKLLINPQRPARWPKMQLLWLIIPLSITSLVCNFSGQSSSVETIEVQPMEMIVTPKLTSTPPSSENLMPILETSEVIQLPEGSEPLNSVPANEKRRMSPGELLSHIDWGGWGAGPGETAGPGEPMCGDGLIEIWLSAYGGSSEIPKYEPRDQIVTGEWLLTHGCDYPPGEEISVTYALPDGTTQLDTVSVDESGFWKSGWLSLPGEPLGTYEVEINSFSADFTGDFSVSKPTNPVLTTVCDPNEPIGSLVLTGFQPGEEVLLARYIDYGDLADYNYVTIDLDGTAIIEFPAEPALVMAYGQDSPREYSYPLQDPIQVSAYDFMTYGPFCQTY